MIGDEDGEHAHDARVLALAAVVGHQGQHLAVRDRGGAQLRVARRHADNVAGLVPGFLPFPVGWRR